MWWHDQETYEEEIGLTVEDDGRTWIENAADELRPGTPTRVAVMRCDLCHTRQAAGYVFAEAGDRFRFKKTTLTTKRWHQLRGKQKWITREYCQTCDQQTPWQAHDIVPYEEWKT